MIWGLWARPRRGRPDEPACSGKVRDLRRGLRGELPRGYEYERLYTLCLWVDGLDQWYGGSLRFAAAGLREIDDVLSAQKRGQRLDRGWDFSSLIGYGFADLPGDGERSVRHGRPLNGRG